MILFNRLIRTDIFLVISVIVMLFVQSEKWLGILQGFAAALLFISILGHIDHYKQTKKFY
jgi:hypothetical protein